MKRQQLNYEDRISEMLCMTSMMHGLLYYTENFEFEQIILDQIFAFLCG